MKITDLVALLRSIGRSSSKDADVGVMKIRIGIALINTFLTMFPFYTA